MPLVPGPSGVWHAADGNCKLKQRTQYHLLQMEELGIESSPMWLGAKLLFTKHIYSETFIVL